MACCLLTASSSRRAEAALSRAREMLVVLPGVWVVAMAADVGGGGKVSCGGGACWGTEFGRGGAWRGSNLGSEMGRGEAWARGGWV